MRLSEMDNKEEGIGTEEHVAVGSCNNNNDATHVIKRKRTKRRLKPLSPCGVVAIVTSSCSSASGGGGGSFSSTTFEGTDQEEEDMANCLILLAQGKGGEANPHHHHHNHHHHHHQHKQPTENHVEGDNKMTERATKSGFYIYECKTCNRTFPSFQALGGHRASHKKPKTQEEKKSSPPPLITSIGHDQFEEGDYKQNQMKNINIISSAPPISLQLGYCGVVKPPNKPNKIHECSICGSEFTSGQALGGHMRRHRASTNNNHVADVDVKSRNVLELDLNLPAPEDDLRDSTFQFPAAQKSVVLSAAPALVGCHY